MIPIEQKVMGFERGDCLSACVASIFELPLSEVPNFHPLGKELTKEKRDQLFWENFRLFVISLGYRLIRVEFADGQFTPEEFPSCYMIASGPSPRNKDKGHAVVYYEGEMIHDPHPRKEGITEVIDYTFFIEPNPRRKGGKS